MGNSLKITILTPTYNRAHTLPRVYESLKKQTFKDFKWIILDDGSTDNTKDVVQSFQQENPFEIEYYQYPNRHKFLTVLEGIRMVETPYHMVVDSDDSYPEKSLELLYEEAEQLEDKNSFIGIMGLSVDEQGKIVGDSYPNKGFDGSILDMRYKYRVRGDKFGIFFSDNYLKYLQDKDYSKYEGKGYIPQSVIFNDYDAKGLKTRFINKVTRVYHKDEGDNDSVSNTRWTGKNVFGLREGHLSFLNSYGSKLFSYPKALLRNIIGYQFYSFKNGNKLSEIMTDIKHPVIKVISWAILPLSFVYHKMK